MLFCFLADPESFQIEIKSIISIYRQISDLHLKFSEKLIQSVYTFSHMNLLFVNVAITFCALHVALQINWHLKSKLDHSENI